MVRTLSGTVTGSGLSVFGLKAAYDTGEHIGVTVTYTGAETTELAGLTLTAHILAAGNEQ